MAYRVLAKSVRNELYKARNWQSYVKTSQNLVNFSGVLRLESRIFRVQTCFSNFSIHGKLYSTETPSEPCHQISSEAIPSDNIAWLKSNDAPRVEERLQLPRNRNLIFRFFLPLLKMGLSSLSLAILQDGTDPRYFPTEFVQGGESALKTICKVISNENLPFLKQITAPELYSVYKNSIELNQKNKIGSHIEVIKIHNSRVKNKRLNIGSFDAFDPSIPLVDRIRKYRIVFSLDFGIATLKTAQNSNSTSTFEIVAGSNYEGFHVLIDFECDADIDYTVSHEDNAILCDSGRRSVVLSLRSPAYKSIDEFKRAYQQAVVGVDNVSPDEKVEPEFGWIISDIDYLLYQKEMEETEGLRR